LALDWLRHNLHSVSERIHELGYGIRTSGWLSEDSLGYSKGDGRVHYTPLPYIPLKRLLAQVAPNPEKDVFIDWGCGMGRVAVLASAYPYRQVLGVEYADRLCVIARENIGRSRVRRNCGRIEIVNGDARDFPVPYDASVMFFFNPFRGDLLTEVIEHIYDSWKKHPREITFLVSNHTDFIKDTGSSSWLEHIDGWTDYPHIGCSVIRTRRG